MWVLRCRCAHSHKYVMKGLTESWDPIWPIARPTTLPRSLAHSPPCSLFPYFLSAFSEQGGGGCHTEKGSNKQGGGVGGGEKSERVTENREKKGADSGGALRWSASLRRAPLSNLTHDTNMTHRLHPQILTLPYVWIPLAPDYANHLSSPYRSQKWVYLAVGWLPMKLPLGSRCTFTHSSMGRFFHVAAFIHVHPLNPPPTKNPIHCSRIQSSRKRNRWRKLCVYSMYEPVCIGNN